MPPIDRPGPASVLALLLVALLPSCSDGVTGPGGGGASMITVTLQSNDLAYDPARDVVYASVSGTSVSHAASVVAIDPVDGSVVSAVVVGDEPSALAISPGAEYLYVGLLEASTVVRLDLSTFTVDDRLPLGRVPAFGEVRAEDIEVLPASPRHAVVSMFLPSVSTRHAGIAVIGDGSTFQDDMRRGEGSNRIEFSDDPSTLYGYNNETTSFGFQRLVVDETGLVSATLREDLLEGFGVDIRFDGGRVYATNGAVIDPVAGVEVGTFPATGLVLPQTARDRVFFVETGTTEVRVFDPDDFSEIASHTVSGVSGARGGLIGIGASRIGFRTVEQVVVVPVSDILD